MNFGKKRKWNIFDVDQLLKIDTSLEGITAVGTRLWLMFPGLACVTIVMAIALTLYYQQLS